MRWNELKDEECPIARGLAVIGDRWTLMILRDSFLGVRRFDQFQNNLGITRHLLANRLKKLQADGMLSKVPYQERPLRHEYRLTDKAKALFPVLVMLVDWADRHMPSDEDAPYVIGSLDTGKPIKPVLADSATGKKLDLRSLRMMSKSE